MKMAGFINSICTLPWWSYCTLYASYHERSNLHHKLGCIPAQQPNNIIIVKKKRHYIIMLATTTARTLRNTATLIMMARGSAVTTAERLTQQPQRRNYHENIVEHYENPRNVGSLDKNSDDVGTVSCILDSVLGRGGSSSC